jgi:hypothetical protein
MCAVVVRNETSRPFHFGNGSARKELPTGQIDTISEDELATVAFDKRGPGKINVLWPNQASSDNPAIKLDYFAFNAGNETRYMGVAPHGSLDSDSIWLIRRFDYVVAGTETKLANIQVIENVAWDDRGTLAWV